MHNLKKFNMNRKYRVRIRCLTFLVTLFWLPLHAQEKVSEKDAFFFCYAARLLSIFIFKTSLVFSIISFGKVILQK